MTQSRTGNKRAQKNTTIPGGDGKRSKPVAKRSLCRDQAGKDGRLRYLRAMQCYIEAGEENLAVRAHAKSIDETEAKLLAIG
jgi:hypothetical protein